MAEQIRERPCLVEMTIEPKSKADEGKLRIALARLALEDLSFHSSIDSKTGRVLLQGMDELHIENKIKLLKRIHQVEVTTGPRRSSIAKPLPARRKSTTRIKSKPALPVSSRP